MQPDDLGFYLDENLCNCRPILDTFRRLGIPFKRHLDIFRPGTADSEWLRRVGQEGWVVLTVDQQIRYNELEKQEVISNKVREFVFSSGNLSGQDMATILEKALPRMKRVCRRESPPFIATVTRGGNVNVVFDRHGSVHQRRMRSRKL